MIKELDELEKTMEGKFQESGRVDIYLRGIFKLLVLFMRYTFARNIAPAPGTQSTGVDSKRKIKVG